MGYKMASYVQDVGIGLVSNIYRYMYTVREAVLFFYHMCTVLYVVFTLYTQESELECIQLQSKVEQLQEEKERLLNSLVEAE